MPKHKDSQVAEVENKTSGNSIDQIILWEQNLNIFLALWQLTYIYIYRMWVGLSILLWLGDEKCQESFTVFYSLSLSLCTYWVMQALYQHSHLWAYPKQCLRWRSLWKAGQKSHAYCTVKWKETNMTQNSLLKGDLLRLVWCKGRRLS